MFHLAFVHTIILKSALLSFLKITYPFDDKFLRFYYFSLTARLKYITKYGKSQRFWKILCIQFLKYVNFVKFLRNATFYGTLIYKT